MYKSKEITNRNVGNWKLQLFQRFSKICLYERPYSITGTVVETGLKEAPKSVIITFIGKDRLIGTWKAENVAI